MNARVSPQVEELTDYVELEGLVAHDQIPREDLSRCFVWRGEDGKIEGYCFIQTVVVVEPIWVEDKHRGRGVAPKLFNEAIKALQEGDGQKFICHAGTPEVQSYLKRLGLEDIGHAFVGRVS